MEAQQFTSLVQQHAGMIHKVALAYCRDATDREDVIQEIAMQLWRSRERYDERFKLATWVYRIALNVAISFHRRERRHGEGVLSIAEHAISIEAPTDEPDDNVQLLLACIDDLNALDKALVLLFLDEYDHPAIAEVLGISVSNVGTKLMRIKDKLRGAFEQRAKQ